MKYVSGQVPKNPVDLPAFLERQFAQLQTAFVELQTFVALFEPHAKDLPKKTAQGTLAYFKAHAFSQGSQEGFWYSNGLVWSNLGASGGGGPTQNDYIALNVQNALPPAPSTGEIRNFAAGIAGTAAGNYEWNGSAWLYLAAQPSGYVPGRTWDIM